MDIEGRIVKKKNIELVPDPSYAGEKGIVFVNVAKAVEITLCRF